MAIVTARADAQRAAPEIVDFGVPSTGQVTGGRMVQWEYWGLMITSCDTSRTLGCTLSVSNGSAADQRLCFTKPGFKVISGAMHAAFDPPETRAGSDASKRCIAVPAHRGVELIVRAKQPLSGMPAALLLHLEETVRDQGGSTLRSPAEIPLPPPRRS